jgi:hypothetical protein
MSKYKAATRVVVTVGTGRGFVVEGSHEWQRYVITAAHGLPAENLLERREDTYQQYPSPISDSGWAERTYRDLLAPLGDNPTRYKFAAA